MADAKKEGLVGSRECRMPAFPPTAEQQRYAKADGAKGNGVPAVMPGFLCVGADPHALTPITEGRQRAGGHVFEQGGAILLVLRMKRGSLDFKGHNRAPWQHCNSKCIDNLAGTCP